MEGVSNNEAGGPTAREQAIIRAIAKPFHDYSDENLRAFASEFLETAGFESDLLDTFVKGVFLAQQPERFRNEDLGLTPDQVNALDYEINHKWGISRTLWSVIIVCSMAAAVQGLNETVVSGAQIVYRKDFKIGEYGKDGRGNVTDEVLLGLINAAPYLSCALVGCWLTEPLNKRFGRRGTIFITCVVSSLSCLWQAFTHSWWHMFIARFVLGLGIGPKSATVPIYAAESSPAPIRGAVTMMWQTWVAFGIMLGFLLSVALYPIKTNISGLNWRLMVASPMFLPIAVCAYVFFCPESPRWLIDKNRFKEAFKALESLRGTKLQAARDLLLIYASLSAEKRIRRETGELQRRKEFWTVPRNWRALRASSIIMALQQLGGVNVIVYHSSHILVESKTTTENKALLVSLGFGILNFLFALPAVWTIDTYGRRGLLLLTFPVMALSLLYTGLSFYFPEGRTRAAMVTVGIYLFTIAYSPGEGPVPFVYSAECYPLHLRDIGMSWSTSVTWLLNFAVGLSLPVLIDKMGNQGTFGFYAMWNVIGFFLIFFFVPETKGKTLEGLDKVFRRSAVASAKRFRWPPRVKTRIPRRDSDRITTDPKLE